MYDLEEIKRRYEEYLYPWEAKNEVSVKGIGKKKTYICPDPTCRSGSHSKGTGVAIDPKSPDQLHFKCHACDFYGDGIELYARHNNMTTEAAIKELAEKLHIKEVDHLPRREKPRATPPTPPAEDFTEYFTECAGRISDPAAVAYLNLRGISPETAAAFNLGFDPAWRSPTALKNGNNPPSSPRLIIPTSKGSYLARDTRPDAAGNFTKMKEGEVRIFNLAALDAAKDGTPVFIVEGEIDAISIFEAGGKAIALGSTSNARKLLEHLKEQPTKAALQLCCDNDNAGRNANNQLAEGLQRLNIRHSIVDICGGYKDPNERLQDDREGLQLAVRERIAATVAPDNVRTYVQSLLAGEIENFKRNAARKTGFANLDKEAGGIYNGLYVLGAISSLGKTTFVHQIADQLAAAGEHVLFFSMEQSRLEMVSKTIARITAINDMKNGMKNARTSLEIRQGNLKQEEWAAALQFAENVSDRLSVIEGNFGTTVEGIIEYVRQYISRTEAKPVVIVDYLQILQSEQKCDRREQTDRNVTALKRLSRDCDIPVIVISSVNRGNYATPIDFESFKESGGIEYTADVVWGLQLAAIHEQLFENDKKTVQKRERINAAKGDIPRKIELVCLKNRYGRSNYSVNFEYHCDHDLFVPAKPKDNDNSRRL